MTTKTPTAGNASNTRNGLLFTGLGGLLLSIDIPLIKLAAAESWTVIVVRGFMVFTALFCVWYFWHRRNTGLPFLNGYTAVCIAVISLVANIMFISAIYLTTTANVVFLLAFQPMIAALLSWIVLGERLEKATVLAITVAMGGIALIVFDGLGSGGTAGILLAFGVAIGNALTLLLVRKAKSDQSMTPAFGALLAAVLVLPFAEPHTLSVSGWGWLTLNGLIVMPAAMALLLLGPRYLSAAVVSLFYLLETVLTPVWMWLIFGEQPTLYTVAGGSIVIASLLAHSLWTLSKAREPNPPRRLPRRNTPLGTPNV